MQIKKFLSPSFFFSLEAYKHAELFTDCAFVWEALNKITPYLEKQKLGEILVDVPSGAYLVDSHLISIGLGTKIDPGVFIQGPCIIGENCHVRHGAYLRGNVVTGNACVIGHATEIKQSILLNRSTAPHFNYVGDSILGNDVNLGAGVICANFRLDHQPVSVTVEGKKYKTGLKKLGAIIGDDSQIGCNSVFSPGSLVGKGVFCYPNVNIHGCITENSRIKNGHADSSKG